MATAFSIDRFLSDPPLTRSRAVARGIPAKALRDLASDPAISIAHIARVVAPRRTLDRRLKEDTPLTADESSRFARFVSILDQTARMLGSRAEAMRWLDSPKQRFDGDRPLDMMRTDAGAREIENLILLARHGMLA